LQCENVSMCYSKSNSLQILNMLLDCFCMCARIHAGMYWFFCIIENAI
jgi:hypothetical protein